MAVPTAAVVIVFVTLRLLESAAERLDRPCTRRERSGRVEREVVVAPGTPSC
ncbi:hypothetical protein [Streptomyces sp. TRM70350]|uniref:hypothetical protein n=1 Tax=Streptomyces sp. TRM70350 TaxID=2856165 RepID=UPI00210F7A41|nr:hypothetical protein [Streptomyces sp. TRM70350]